MSNQTYWKLAKTRADLDAAQALRFQCLGGEMGIPIAYDADVGRDISSLDNLSTTHHILVYNNTALVGTARLALPNSDVRFSGGSVIGVELEHDFSLSGLLPLRSSLAEVARVCILKEWRGTTAPIKLYEGLYVVSRQLGVNYWVGGVDCQTSSAARARRMYELLVERGQISNEYRAEPRARDIATLATRGGNREAQDGSVQLATTIRTFSRRLGAECLGTPAPHHAFPGAYVVPMLANLERIPAATLVKFGLPESTLCRVEPTPSYLPIQTRRKVS